jgi:formate-dependent phosphoribosylglycinamide formyltransferase (GAR transformylase)
MSEKRAARDREARLESILAKHSAVEKRTLADLRAAGFAFSTIAQAEKYRKQRATLHRLVAEDAYLADTHIEKRRAS